MEELFEALKSNGKSAAINTNNELLVKTPNPHLANSSSPTMPLGAVLAEVPLRI
jgi:hypothetical protein